MKLAEDQPDLDFTGEDSDHLSQWRSTVQPPEKPLESMELNFATGSDQLTSWRAEQAEKMLQIAQREGLPIGEKVRVVLQSDLELTGRLLIDPTHSDLEIDGVAFAKSELISCVKVE